MVSGSQRWLLPRQGHLSRRIEPPKNQFYSPNLPTTKPLLLNLTDTTFILARIPTGPSAAFMRARAIAALSLASFLVGGAAGYWARPPSTRADHPLAPAPAIPPPPPARPLPQDLAAAPRPEPDEHRASANHAPSLRERLQSILWQRQVGTLISISPFVGSQLDSRFAQILGLDEATAARLLAAGRTAEQQITQWRDARATAHLSDDRKHLVVDVPPLDAETSRSIYDRFNAEFAAALDPDRLALANAVAGEQLDRLYDRFGLNAVRYELDLDTTDRSNGGAAFQYKRSWVDADGVSRGWGSGNQTLEAMFKSDPILARFVSSIGPP